MARTAKANRIGTWIIISVTFLVFGYWLQYSIRKHYRLAMASELASGGDYWGLPMANHSNTKVFFAKRSEHGVGLYIRDTDGKVLLLAEERQELLIPTAFRLLGWSPDDRFFANVTHHQSVWIRDGQSGRLESLVGIPGSIICFTWLSPEAFAVFNGNQNLLVFKRAESGEWVQMDSFSPTGNNKFVSIQDLSGAGPRDLVALSPESVAWRQHGTVWKFYFRSRDPKAEKLWDSKTNSVTDFCVSKDGESVLLNCTEKGGKLAKIPRYATKDKDVEFIRIFEASEYISKVSWINNDSGYAYLSSRWPNRQVVQPWAVGRGNALFVKRDAESDPVRIMGEVLDYTVNGSHLYISGCLSNEPTAIWDYNLESSSLRCLTQRAPFKHARLSSPEIFSITNSAGDVIPCRLWPPVGSYLSKKHPVIIGQFPYRWITEAQVAANSGYYFAVAERPSWYEGKDNGARDILSLYESLAQNTNIDTNRVFLFGTSGETISVSDLFRERPELWKGACILAPGQLPMVSTNNNHLSGILAVSQTNNMATQLGYQNSMALMGVPIKLVFRKGPHSWTAIKTEREHARQIAAFLLENN